MKKIESFTVDHTRLKRGVYVSRRDPVECGLVTTLDLRMKEPDKEPALAPACSHALEHLGATFLRNHPSYENQILYFGPMGCLTGFYLMLKGEWSAREGLAIATRLFRFMADYRGDIPGAGPVECGNHRLMDPEGARIEARKYLAALLAAGEENLSYPE